MEEQNLHSDKDTFLAKWLAGELTDDALKSMVSETEYLSFLKLRKGIQTHEGLDSSTEASFVKIKKHISKFKNQEKAQDKEVVIQLKTKGWILGIAASVVLLFGLFFILDDNIVTIETTFGEQKIIALLDGSEVILNSKSSLSYDKDDWENDRTLNLKGEGYFKVKKGSMFTVVTHNGAVKVLGTQFNVNSLSDLFEVICFEGKVSVKSKEENYILLPTNSVRRINGYGIEQWATVDLNPSWINGESTFKSVPLKYVISGLESQYNITIDAKDINSNLVYTGSFTHKDLHTALKTVFKSLRIRYIEKENQNIYLSTK